MDTLGTSFFWVTLAQIMMINIVLSGDNAVVIAMASRALPERQQKQAIIFGSFGAIFLRVILTFFAVMLLDLPFLKLVGAVLLVWIGVKMLAPEGEENELDGHSNLWAAIKTIIIADFVMSLDNVLGVAAAAKGSVLLLVLGLAISIPLIIYGSTLILKLMNRFPIIVTAGGAILGWVGGEMAVTDPIIKVWVEVNAHELHTLAPIVGALLVVGLGIWLARAAEKEGTMEPQVTAAVVEEAPPGYRWVSRRWKTLPDGTRDYAIYHGQEAFRELVPVSSKLRAANPYPLLVPELEPGSALEREPQLEPAYAVVRESADPRQ
jgi:YjbE family integral membrane protein